VSELASKTTEQVNVGIQVSIPEANDDTVVARSPMVDVNNEKLIDKQLTN
jgi:hypothetical protein